MKYFLFSILFFAGSACSWAHPPIDTTTVCASPESLDLTDHASNQVDSRLAGKSAATALATFSVRGTTASTTYVRNPNVWTEAGAPLDLTGVSAWTNEQATTATLISPRHFLSALHYSPQIGSIVVFVRQEQCGL